MEPSYYLDIYKAIIRELINFKRAVVAVFLSVCFIVLLVGALWPKSFKTSALLYAETTNIIQPLLKGRAQITDIDRSKQAAEVIYTRRIMEAVAEKSGLLKGDEDASRKESVISGLRNRVSLSPEGKNHFRIGFYDNSADTSFDVLNNVVTVFINDTSKRKREESVGAFNFIDTQVKSYKRQLEEAELQLKEFKAKNTEGTEASVNKRINDLRATIENLKLEIDEEKARKVSIEQQLAQESQYQASKSKVDEYQERLQFLQKQLDDLRLSYKETYPDIVSLKTQMSEIEWAIENIQGKESIVASSSSEGGAENPLHEELRKKLSEAELVIRTSKQRLKSLKRLLQQEFKRAEKVAANQAELMDLTRDYNVTRQVYEEMLERKESARLSMTLDIEGQGVSYKIQEPAVFPLKASGLTFIHFSILGPLLALMLPIGLVVAYVIVDPRIRSAMILKSQLPPDVELLGEVPHINTPLAQRLIRSDIITLVVVCGVGMAVYVGLVTLGLMKGL